MDGSWTGRGRVVDGSWTIRGRFVDDSWWFQDVFRVFLRCFNGVLRVIPACLHGVLVLPRSDSTFHRSDVSGQARPGNLPDTCSCSLYLDSGAAVVNHPCDAPSPKNSRNHERPRILCSAMLGRQTVANKIDKRLDRDICPALARRWERRCR